MIRIVPPEDPRPLRRAAAEPDAFDWIVFTSANAVEAFMAALLERRPRRPRAEGTAALRRRHRHGRASWPSTASRSTSCRTSSAPRRSWRRWPHAARSTARACCCRGPTSAARSSPTQLRDAGALVTDVVAYRTVLEDTQRDGDPDVYGMLLDGRIDVVTFTSASAVRNFAKIYGAEQAADLLEEHRRGGDRPGDRRRGGAARHPRDGPAGDVHDPGAGRRDRRALPAVGSGRRQRAGHCPPSGGGMVDLSVATDLVT